MTYSTGGTTSYVYDATGRKLCQVFTNPSSTIDYCGNMVYENGTLKRIEIDGGYIGFSNNGMDYYYYLKDHQGNNRVVVYDTGGRAEVNHYYPFGLLFGESEDPETQRYKYNGKEFDRYHGLDMYDYGARFYDPSICRFTTMDPMCEKYYHFSPYIYCGNNPVNYVDPNGMDWVQKDYDGRTEFYYDRTIKSQDDINKKYGSNSGISYLSNNSKIEIGGELYTFKNDLNDNKYGYVIKDGKKLDNSNIYYGENYTIFGTTDNSVDAQTLHKNYFGTSYTGPNNPKTYLGKESYQYIPQNRSEYGSYIHDLLYNKAKAVGIKGALGNTSQEVIDADFFLARYNYLNMMNPQTPLIDKSRSALTASVFTIIAGYKSLLNTLKK